MTHTLTEPDCPQSVREQINGDVTQEAPRRQLFLDCDGVLADFDAAFEKQFGHPPRKYEEQHGPQTFWRNIREEAAEFYRHLPLMEGARELYEAVKHLRPIILTGCPLGGWAEMQKIEWAREHFPGVPIITCMSKDKRVYAQPGDILIDDYLKYRHLWEEHGGIFIHHTSVEKSLSELFTLTTAQAEREQLEARVKVLEAAVAISVQPMKTTAGHDYFVTIKVGDREMTPYMFKEQYKAEYTAEEFRWLMHGTEKPDLMVYNEDDSPGRAALQEKRP